MASLSTLFGGGSGGADPLIEGLPVVAVYGGDFNQRWDVKLHRVHSGELVGTPWAAITNSTASYSHGMSNLHEFGYQSDRGSLSSQMTTQAYTSYTEFTQSLFQNDHYPYAMFGSCSGDGRIGMHSFHSTDFYLKIYNRIHVQMPRGQRPRRQFNIQNYNFSETEFNSHFGWKSAVDLSTYIDTAGHVSNNNGSAVYKQDTKQLVLYYATSTGSATGYFHLVQGTVDLMEVRNVKEFFDTATYKKFHANTTATTWGYSSLNYSVALVLGDNNHLGMSPRNGSSHRYVTFDLDVADGSTVPPIVNDVNNNTTSYGPENNLMYRVRYQQTWDSEWACLYGPYYYYGGGLSAFFMSTANPSKYYKVIVTETSGGGGLFPSGTSGFKWLNGQNTDSNPIRSWGVDFNNIQSPTDNTVTEYIGLSVDTRSISLPTGVANGGTLRSSVAAYSFQYPGYSYTTSYPRFMSVNWWNHEGAYQK